MNTWLLVVKVLKAYESVPDDCGEMLKLRAAEHVMDEGFVEMLMELETRHRKGTLADTYAMIAS